MGIPVIKLNKYKLYGKEKFTNTLSDINELEELLNEAKEDFKKDT